MFDRELIIGGAVPLDRGIYISRHTDTSLYELLRDGEYCNVLCSRMTGKTSAIHRVRHRLRMEGFRTVLIDVIGRIGRPDSPEKW